MAFFAANSLLARLALRGGAIDAGAFTAIRIVSGAGALAVLARFRRGSTNGVRQQGSLRSAFALFCYAVAFSFAYLSLDASTGALALFAAVQITMLVAGITRGERPRPSEWFGLAVAFGGLIYLAWPGLTAPSPVGLLLMMISGVAWGYYSLAGAGAPSAIAATAGNFARAVPMALAVLVGVWGAGRLHASWSGVALAAVCGAVTSGLGYAIWYVALKSLRTSLAAIVQLTVPVLAGIAGAALLGESLAWRLAIASVAILGGVAVALFGRSPL